MAASTASDTPASTEAVETLIDRAMERARSGRSGLLPGRRRNDDLEELRRALEGLGVPERARLRDEITALRREADELRARQAEEAAVLRAQLDDLRRQVVETEERAILQEVGIYEYRHPLDDAVAYKGRLAEVRAQLKAAAKAGAAVTGSTSWSVNGSAREGAKMVREFSKLMLRAYNNEADNCVRTLKPYALPMAVQRLEKARSTIVKLGATMGLHVADDYHRLRILELELTSDYLAKVAEEKERERERRERERDEAAAQRELEREQAKLEKERSHYLAALAAMRASTTTDPAVLAEAEAKVAEIDRAIIGVQERAANVRTGYVYVISNIGSFGERVVKIGLTRRLDPLDRIRELGDASVPFRFDVHAVIFSEDAVSLETQLHQALADRRVNLVNSHREFFYATPGEVRALLERLQGNLLSYTEEPEALEWRQSAKSRAAAAAG